VTKPSLREGGGALARLLSRIGERGRHLRPQGPQGSLHGAHEPDALPRLGPQRLSELLHLHEGQHDERQARRDA
jgi:hypothetical protein